MFIRSQVRYNCFSKKKGNPPRDQSIVDLIETQLVDGYEWSNFADVWDVAVSSTSIKVIPNITDIARVSEVCTQAAFFAKKGFDMEFDTEEDKAIVDMVESHFLEGKMTWANFRTHWNIRWDNERNRIETYLINIQPNQKTVTPEMIEAVITRGQTAAELQAAIVKGK